MARRKKESITNPESGIAGLGKPNVPRPDKSFYMIQAVSNALSLLELFNDEVAELGLQELRNRLELSSQATERLVATLERRGYLELNRLTGCYRLGLKTYEISRTFLAQAELFRHAQMVLKNLVNACNETAYIATMHEYLSTYLEAVETTMTVRVTSRIGSRLPAYCTAAGKVLLAALPPERLAEYLGRVELSPYTDRTITDRETLARHLETIAVQGYAVGNEELEEGIRGVAAPIRNHIGRVVAAVIISGPAMRLTDERLAAELIPLVRTAASEISLKLGYLAGSRQEAPTAMPEEGR